MPNFQEKLTKQTKQTDSQDESFNKKTLEQQIIKQLINNAIKKHQQQTQKQLQKQIIEGRPPMLNKNKKFAFTIILTIIMCILNSQQLFLKSSEETSTILIEKPKQLQKKVQFVFQHTIFKYSIIYTIQMQECRPFFDFAFKQSLCTNKYLNLKIKFIYSVGFKPDLDSITVDLEKNMVYGDWGSLQILNVQTDDEILFESSNMFNSWKIVDYKNKLNQKIQTIKPFAEGRVKQYIYNATSNSNSVENLQNSIRNFLNKIAYENKKKHIPVIGSIMNKVDKAFNKILNVFQITPISITQEESQIKQPFSEEEVTEFQSEEILLGEEDFQIQQKITVDKMTQSNQNQHQQKRIDSYDLQKGRKMYEQLNKKIHK